MDLGLVFASKIKTVLVILCMPDFSRGAVFISNVEYFLLQQAKS